MTGPLEGLLVADLSRVLAGPFATMLLGDLGADVVKVEHPDGGDETRAWRPPFLGDHSTYFLAVNRNKRSVALDLRQAPGRAAALALAERADVLVENFKPGALGRLGLGFERIRERNPGLVWCSISGFGGGPGADLPGYDFLVQASSGLMSITGPAGGEPTKVGVALVDDADRAVRRYLRRMRPFQVAGRCQPAVPASHRMGCWLPAASRRASGLPDLPPSPVG
jgi:crotonobetainyl-CoA:carnitine CoA-transferase CaiB-like acyl-CoA transferase